MARTIQVAVDEVGLRIGADELVNFGSCHRREIDPSTGRRSYWFRYGDIQHLTLPQVQAAIGQIAAAGLVGGADVMRVSAIPVDEFVVRPGTGFFGLDEFIIDEPVLVKCSVGLRTRQAPDEGGA